MPETRKNMNRTTAKKSIRRILSVMLVLLAFLIPVHAAGPEKEQNRPLQSSAGTGLESTVVDPIDNREGWSAVLYNNRSGLPTSEANDIAETNDGFIWIGSYSGLTRYDGDTFEAVDPATGITNVKCLYVDTAGRLWIGTNDNGIVVMELGNHQRWNEADGLKSASVRGIAEDGNGVIYAATTGGLNRIDPEMNLSEVFGPDGKELQIDLLQNAWDGSICGLTYSGDILVIEDGQITEFLSRDDNYVKNIGCIFPDPDNKGYFYLDTGGTIVYYGSIENRFRETKIIEVSPLHQIIKYAAVDQDIWLCARNGIGVLKEDGFHLLQNVPMDNSVGNMMTDYEGNLWFTSSRQGVMKIVPNQFTDLSQRFDLSEMVVNATCMLEDQLFVGTDTGLMVWGEDYMVPELPLTKAETASGVPIKETDLLEMLGGCRIRSIIRDSKDRLWISTWRSMGLLCYDHGELTAYTEADGLSSDQVHTAWECQDGSILAACTGGIDVIKDGVITKSCKEAEGIENTDILMVTEGMNGEILVGTDGSGIYILDDSGARHIGTKDGLTSGAVMRIKKDPFRDLYWIVTGNSIAYMTEDFQVTTIRNFPSSNNLDLFINSREEIWVLAGDGVYILPAENMIEDGDINPVHYGLSNGLPCIVTANAYSELTNDGELYIAGNTGVAKINIEESYQNVYDLKASVPYIETDGTRIYPDETGCFTIPFNVRKLTIYGFVFNYALVDPPVSYCLENFDREYVTVRRSSLLPVTYTNLRGGTYHFVLHIKNPLGGGDKIVSVRIVKKKALYENTWFYVAAALAIFAVLALCFQRYVRKRIRDLETKHKEEAEKERISAELEMASRIQNSMLPHQFPPFPDRTEFDIYASMKPAKEVGGDFYDYFLIDEDHLGLVVADVSGKGIPAALFMMVSKVILQSVAMLGKTAAETLTLTNEALCSDNQVEMFVTVWLGILEISTGKITAANAGHEYPAVMKNGRFELLKDRHGFVIGGMDGIKYKEYEIVLEPGDKLFLYTDGVPEATDAENKMFGTERMLSALNEDAEAAPQQILDHIRSAVDGFVKEAEQFDDLTMLCLEYKGGPADAKIPAESGD